MMKATPKLHELIAVRSGTKTQAAKTMADLQNTFEKKETHFRGYTLSFTPSDESAGHTVIEKKLDIQTTVNKELGWLSQYLSKAIDSSNAVNVGNTKAVADVVLEDGTLLLTNVSATTLLELEDTVESLRNLVSRIPTLDPVKGFEPDPSAGEDIYAARVQTKTRSQKSKKVYVLYAATDKHPAQTQLLDEDIPVGTIEEREWSGLLTPSRKGSLLDRIEMLARGVKQARSRANATEVEAPAKIGEILVDYAFGL